MNIHKCILMKYIHIYIYIENVYIYIEDKIYIPLVKMNIEFSNGII